VSQENVEIVRRTVEAILQGEWEQAGQLLDPDAEGHGTVGGLSEGTVLRGVTQFRQSFEQEDAEAWDERRLDAEEFIDAGDRVVVLVREFRRGKGSGIELEVDTAIVFEVRDGRVIRIQGYMDRDEALEAVWLWE
jgi:ketosteroid isomerase-like protein